MPTYQYACTECGHDFEQVQKFSDDALTECPQCTGKLRKVYNAVGVVFKGSGFYRNDSRPSESSSSESSSSDSTSEKASSDTKSDTKSADKTSSDAKPAKAADAKPSSDAGSSASKTPAPSTSGSAGS